MNDEKGSHLTIGDLKKSIADAEQRGISGDELWRELNQRQTLKLGNDMLEKCRDDKAEYDELCIYVYERAALYLAETGVTDESGPEEWVGALRRTVAAMKVAFDDYRSNMQDGDHYFMNDIHPLRILGTAVMARFGVFGEITPHPHSNAGVPLQAFAIFAITHYLEDQAKNLMDDGVDVTACMFMGD